MNPDVVSMLGNLSRSLLSVETLLSGLAYILGILFVIAAIMKLKKMGEGTRQVPSHEKMMGPLVLFMMGISLIFLPTMLKVLSSTAFGTGNILQYIAYNPGSIYSSMGILIQTAGLIWFVRGCVLLVHGSEPGAKAGPKGLMFVAAGILAMNFQYTYEALNYFMNQLFSLTGMGST